MSLLSPRGKFTASLCEGALVLQGKIGGGEFVTLTGLVSSCIVPLQQVSALQRITGVELKAIELGFSSLAC